MTIKDMHDMIDTLKNEGQTGYHTPEEIDRALNNASDDKFNAEKKIFESTGIISDNLRTFKTSATISLTSGSGSLPSDYSYRTGASTTGDLPVEILSEGEWVYKINDPIDPPSSTRPIMAIRNTVSVLPNTLSSVVLYYLKRPATMVFGYTVTDGENVYNSGTSTQPDWAPDCHVDIVLRACVYLGVPLKEQDLIRLKAYKTQTENV